MSVNTTPKLQFNFFNKLQALSGYNSYGFFGFDSDMNKQFAEAAYSNTHINTTRVSPEALGYNINNPWFRDKYDDIVSHPSICDCYA